MPLGLAGWPALPPLEQSKYICSECGSDRIGWDAWADENGEVISVMDHNECLECESTYSAIERPKQEGAA